MRTQHTQTGVKTEGLVREGLRRFSAARLSLSRPLSLSLPFPLPFPLPFALLSRPPSLPPSLPPKASLLWQARQRDFLDGPLSRWGNAYLPCRLQRVPLTGSNFFLGTAHLSRRATAHRQFLSLPSFPSPSSHLPPTLPSSLALPLPLPLSLSPSVPPSLPPSLTPARTRSSARARASRPDACVPTQEDARRGSRYRWLARASARARAHAWRSLPYGLGRGASPQAARRAGA